MQLPSPVGRLPALHQRRRHRVARGTITLVQEGRFQVEDFEGRRRLFVLAHDAPLDQTDLQALLAAGCPVEVEFADAEGLLASVAHDVQPLAS